MKQTQMRTGRNEGGKRYTCFGCYFLNGERGRCRYYGGKTTADEVRCDNFRQSDIRKRAKEGICG